MNNKESTERLSASLDDELQGVEAERLVDDLLEDAELRERWRHYHLQSDTLRHELPVRFDLNLYQRVSSRLQEYLPTVTHISAGVSHPGSSVKRTGRWLKPLSAVAIAASVASVAILGLQQLPQQPQQTQLTTQQSSDEYLRLPEAVLARRSQEANDSKQAAELLDRYLVNHNEYSVTSGIHGVLPYARIVSSKDAK